MTSQDDPTSEPMTDPQTHLDTDPTNTAPAGDGGGPDTVDDPAHDDEDEGWGSEGGAAPSGPATDT